MAHDRAAAAAFAANARGRWQCDLGSSPGGGSQPSESAQCTGANGAPSPIPCASFPIVATGGAAAWRRSSGLAKARVRMIRCRCCSRSCCSPPSAASPARRSQACSCWCREAASTRILPHFISFATGALLGAALLALLPEAIEGAGTAGAHAHRARPVAALACFSSSRSSCCGGTRMRTMRATRMPVHVRSTRTTRRPRTLPPVTPGTPMPATITPVNTPPACWC